MQEYLTPGYQGQICEDRTCSGGGVMLAFKSCYSVEEIELEKIDETAWDSVNTAVNRKVFGVFHRPPDHNPCPVEQLGNAITQVMTK